MKTNFILFYLFMSINVCAQYIPVDTINIQCSTFTKRYRNYNESSSNFKEQLGFSYFLDLKNLETYVIVEEILDIYESFNKKPLNGEVLYNYLEERNFLLVWYGHLTDVEDTKIKIYKLSKEQLCEILSL